MLDDITQLLQLVNGADSSYQPLKVEGRGLKWAHNFVLVSVANLKFCANPHFWILRRHFSGGSEMEPPMAEIKVLRHSKFCFGFHSEERRDMSAIIIKNG